MLTRSRMRWMPWPKMAAAISAEVAMLVPLSPTQARSVRSPASRLPARCRHTTGGTRSSSHVPSLPRSSLNTLRASRNLGLSRRCVSTSACSWPVRRRWWPHPAGVL
ncbi:MAG: hypothetical protein J3K34DRAFT_421072 [Monoraphidium minutum]|nr:MAG: hypothetical protein J3K34DRAFT_421072 [Monoraphidium minutum]